MCASQSHSAPRVLPSVFYTTSQTATSTWFPFTPTCRLALFQRGTRDTEATSLTSNARRTPETGRSTGEGSRTALEGHKPRRTAQSRRLFSSARERARATEREREREKTSGRAAWKALGKGPRNVAANERADGQPGREREPDAAQPVRKVSRGAVLSSRSTKSSHPFESESKANSHVPPPLPLVAVVAQAGSGGHSGVPGQGGEQGGESANGL